MPAINDPNGQPQKQPRLSEKVFEECRRQELEREEQQAFSVENEEPKFDASNPGGGFGRRIAQRIQQKRFEQ